jgi:hypothetical protein
MVVVLKEVEAQAIVAAGYGICPRCEGPLSVYNERRFLKKISKLHCHSCSVFWEDIILFHREVEQASINGLQNWSGEPWPFEVPFLLEKNEVAYMVFGSDVTPVGLYEGRTSGDDLTFLDDGKLVLANNRLLFVGRKRSISTKLKNLISVDTEAELGYDGFLHIAREGKQQIEAYLLRMPNFVKEVT